MTEATGTRYVLDANVFIEAKKRYYSFAVCPGFWDALLWNHGEGRVWSIDRVRAELVDYGDDLSEWVKTTVPTAAFCSTDDPAVLGNYAAIVGWAMGQPQFTDGAKAEFAKAEVADAWLIAYAMTHGATLVTHETLDEQIRRRVKMPNVCREFGVAYLDSFEMLNALDAKFVWAAP